MNLETLMLACKRGRNRHYQPLFQKVSSSLPINIFLQFDYKLRFQPSPHNWSSLSKIVEAIWHFIILKVNSPNIYQNPIKRLFIYRLNEQPMSAKVKIRSSRKIFLCPAKFHSLYPFF